jgi:P27 family predicted phage terminase small subunit
MSPAAVTEWERVVEEVRDLGIITKLDRAVLAIYCAAWSRFIVAERQMAAALEAADVKLWVKLAAVEERAARECQRACAVLGFTPVDRGRIEALVNTEPERPKDAEIAHFG